MDTITRYKLDMADRLRSFLRANPLEGEGDRVAIATFEGLVARAEQLVRQHEANRIARLRATIHRGEFRQELETTLLGYLVAVASTATRDIPDLTEEFHRLRHRRPDRACPSHLALGTWHFALGTSHLALRTSHFALRTSHLVLST